ncbi:transcriptional regulator, LacI family [Candidatus Koribacter versatilis Ellin345]|uniref:Transcriptional regulator, LacI family n=1 Tax=Koribacter versatilis (strain Ellin345) TaxID=204669 RepID=Q1IUW6_KORVE|nr:LacI family DNA-binding transcriptional regulator [Candidatus Koribacter versatilis]ABF39334.1 transcriptional regulator, LacI family [Candidatus Koribacter versatilis Ellin345]
MDIREIAKRAKVSTATVSRTINRVPTVDPKLAKRVWRVVDELGYFPNTQARALVSGRSRILGLVVSEITNPFFPEIVQVFENIAVQNNYEILLTSTGHDPVRMEIAVRRMIEHRVEGVALMTFGMEESLLENLKRRKIPMVIVDVGPPRPLVSNIRVDYQHGIRQAVQHLAALRHHRIAFISGPLRLPSARARLDAFKNAMHELDLPAHDELWVEGTHTIEGGVEAAGRLLSLPSRPTAIMCSNDMTALGVMRKSHELGIHIPHDLSLIGFDNIHISEFVLPPLTTIEMSQAELATLAFNALLAELQRKTPNPNGTEYALETHLILRESTARPKQEADNAKKKKAAR